MMIDVAGLLERAILWLLRSDYEKLDIAAYVERVPPAHRRDPGAARQRPAGVDAQPACACAQAELTEDGSPRRWRAAWPASTS